jgi:hypothetical protein
MSGVEDVDEPRGRPGVDGTDWIELSEHAVERWKARTPSSTKIGPRVAWLDAEDAVVPEPTGLDADEVRYHAPTRTVLLRKDSHMVTVIDLSALRTQARRAVARVR